MIEPEHRKLSIRTQSRLLSVNRNRLKSKPRQLSAKDRTDMIQLYNIHTRYPVFGSRKLSHLMKERGTPSSRHRVTRLMNNMGLKPIKSQSRTSLPNKQGGKRPYLLRDLSIKQPDQVWCTDITYIPMRKGFAYVTMIMDWYSRAIISWQVSNTLDSRFCLKALREAVEKAGKTPQILNTDQGSQYTSQTWLETVEDQYKIQASMDGKGRWKDNVMIERLWRSLKHERLYLCAPRDIVELEEIVEDWVQEYNEERPHQSHHYKTPWKIYRPESTPGKLFTSRFDSDELSVPILAEAIS